ncbi:hypothetical protein PF002_g27496 [Phytophthora fragariae]|uniref:Protein kinase domain-containing protein n=2 Tax=Phytophthora fragariae TaxID=53985 RepID=A0A6A3W8I9_9STRA|nr:hypothetical protein PF006_g26262 [Phytophthora fragariae]KAE9180670.1 hypothetical protein PF002_g27496 [Phytophthora fragariae]KAE9276315.1 hypothetical protein PF001_g26185 [Phytophthora fragariae]
MPAMELHVPGPSCPLSEALAAAASLCQQMHEHELMCAHLEPAAEPELGLGDIVASLTSFLRERSFLKRLANSRKVEQTLRGFYEALDRLQQPPADHSPHWRRQWTSDRRAALREFADLAASAQNEADETAAAHWQLMQRTLRRLCAATGVAAAGAAVDLPAVPDWFIPSDDVDFDARASFDCGSYGSVHRGTWTKGATGGSGAKVVVKCLLEDDAEAKQSFYQEVAVWRRLDHPHVLKLYGACHVSSPAFFVCDDATRGSFSDFLEQDAGRRQRWRLFYEAALGLGYLHAEKVVHGDLKCTNLLVGSDCKAKLCDFGFSYVRSQSVGLSAKSQTEAIRWKAPECLAPPDEEASAQFNPRFTSDVYSLGMCVIEAFQGEAPYGLADDDEIMARLFELEPYPRPAELQDDEWALVERMVQPDWRTRVSLQDAIDGLKALADREAEAERAASTRACAFCEARMPVEFAFCGACGPSMSRGRTEQSSSAAAQHKNACPRCEEDVQSTDRFCRHCGCCLDADPAFA